MENFSFCTPTRYIFGHGAECEAAGLCKEAGWKTVMVVYGGSSAIRSGLLGRVRDSLAEAGINIVELGGVKPNPTDDKVYEGIALGREKGIDSLLAVGGGSVIDTAKAIAAGVCYEGDFGISTAAKQRSPRHYPSVWSSRSPRPEARVAATR